jgi:hypothetical protein
VSIFALLLAALLSTVGIASLHPDDIVGGSPLAAVNQPASSGGSLTAATAPDDAAAGKPNAVLRQNDVIGGSPIH